MALAKYVDKLPIPPVLAPVSSDNGVDYYEVTMKGITQKLHRDLDPTTLYGYEGIYPGPTIVAESNKPIRVKWMNNLPVTPHLLPVDKTVHGAGGVPEVRTVVHLHGANVQPDSDGFPEAWFINNFQEVGPTFANEVYYYPNKQSATTLFYHDHALGITRLNVYAGLAGAYIIRDEIEENLNLPKGEFEIPLIIQDRTFDPDVNGALFYPSQPDNAIPGVTPDPSVVPEFFGDTILVNGMVWPFLEVRPQRYRFRIVNGSNSRFYNIKLNNTGAGSTPNWVQIGTDSGFLEAPVPLINLTLAPGERADTIIDFSGFTGSSFEFTNDAAAPFPMGTDPDPDTTGKIMRFDVVLPFVEDGSEVPTSLTAIDWLKPGDAATTRYSTLVETTDQYQRLLLLLDNLMWDDPITQKPKLNTIEVWNIVNTTMDTHPIHLHLVKFQILGRRPFDVAEYNASGNIVYTGAEIGPDANEKGWKDTVRSNPGEVTRFITKFGDFTGIYPWHCHILEHEDSEMMRPYEVVRKPAK